MLVRRGARINVLRPREAIGHTWWTVAADLRVDCKTAEDANDAEERNGRVGAAAGAAPLVKPDVRISRIRLSR